MTSEDSAPKLHIDSDWKAEAQAEKERLVNQEKPKGGKSSGRDQLPEASFQALLGMLASQAIMGLGAVADPKSGGMLIDLEGAQFCIDLLSVLQEKTKGNLTDEESSELTQLLAELRARFVQITQLIAEQSTPPGPTSSPESPITLD